MKKMLFTLLVLFIVANIFAQDKILLEIDNEKISAEEFLHIYKKNNTDANAMKYSAMKEYMDLFCNFKLKVHEAEVLGLDTMPSFKSELNGYKSQLAQPYLSDKKVEDESIAEAYERMKYDIEVSHILVKVPKNANPEDTLKAYNRIYEAYNRLKKGEDFGKIVKEYSQEEGSQATNGSIGYRTAFGLIYDFEIIMYNTQVGSFSEPFRTNFGYHILKVTNKRPAKGRYRVAHIMKVVPSEITSQEKSVIKSEIDKIYDRLKNGEDFAKLAEETSDDRRTAANGGELGWISVGGRMIKEFEDAVFNIQNVGDISPVLETGYGYHIIKLLEIEPIKPLDEVKNTIKTQLANSVRTTKSRQVVLDKLKVEYNLKTYSDNLNDFYKYVTDSIFYGTWKINENDDLSKKLLTFNDKSFTQRNFADYLMKYNRKQSEQNLKIFINDCFNTFVDNTLVEYEETVLESKYPSFKYLVKEYNDGILLFELTDKMVWSKAVKDTVGLQKFYAENKDKYVWDYRYDVRVYKCKDAKTSKTLEKSLLKDQNDAKILAKLNKKDSLSVVLTEKQLNEIGVTLLTDRLVKDNNIPKEDKYVKVINNTEDNSVTLVKVIAPQIKTLNEARGIITADYQNYLEKEWIKDLKSKYKIVIHDDVLRSISE